VVDHTMEPFEEPRRVPWKIHGTMGIFSRGCRATSSSVQVGGGNTRCFPLVEAGVKYSITRAADFLGPTGPGNRGTNRCFLGADFSSSRRAPPKAASKPPRPKRPEETSFQ